MDWAEVNNIEKHW